jgi:catechol 2,3-dioxygenase
MTTTRPSYSAPVGTLVAHVAIPVARMDRMLEFYRDVLGFEVSDDSEVGAPFLSPGGDVHHLGLRRVPEGSALVGQALIGIRFPRRSALAKALRRILDEGRTPEEARRLGTRELVAFRDPEGNLLELFWEHPHTAATLPPAEGEFEERPLDLDELLASADDPDPGQSGSPGPGSGPVDATTLAQVREQVRIDEALTETFPASDPVSVAIDPVEPRPEKKRDQGGPGPSR